MRPKAYGFINARWPSGDLIGLVIDEAGGFLGEHLSSNEAWLEHDLGRKVPDHDFVFCGEFENVPDLVRHRAIERAAESKKEQ